MKNSHMGSSLKDIKVGSAPELKQAQSTQQSWDTLSTAEQKTSHVSIRKSLRFILRGIIRDPLQREYSQKGKDSLIGLNSSICRLINLAPCR